MASQLFVSEVHLTSGFALMLHGLPFCNVVSSIHSWVFAPQSLIAFLCVPKRRAHNSQAFWSRLPRPLPGAGRGRFHIRAVWWILINHQTLYLDCSSKLDCMRSWKSLCICISLEMNSGGGFLALLRRSAGLEAFLHLRSRGFLDYRHTSWITRYWKWDLSLGTLLLSVTFAEFSLSLTSTKQTTVVLKSSRFSSAPCKHVPPALGAPESGNALVAAAVFSEIL